MRPPKQAPLYRVILSGILICSMLLSMLVVPGLAARTNKHVLRQKKATLQHNIRAVRVKLHQIKVKESKTRQQLTGVEHQVRVARGQLHVATLRLQRAQLELHHANENLKQAKVAFTGSQEKASERIVATYERGEGGYLEFLLSSASFADLLERVQLTKFMREQDRGTLDELKQRKDVTARYQQQVQGKTHEVQMWRQQVAVWHQRTIEEQCQVASNLHEVKGERMETEAEIDALIHESNAIEAMIQRMERTPRGRARYNRVYAGAIGGLPVRGRITSRFGYRVHPISGIRKLHTGVDIAAPTGTPIVAPGGGEVIFAGRRKGYGNCVMIDHGHGKTTLYGHMSAIATRVGHIVRRGELIGRVGSTGYSTGPHCHFEVRINGRPVNPLGR